ncbi:UbiH/UbiF/VisC/COQ6 family ubiquinone biosynthesis hydroxylase [Fretibacter rubidus]|uniref:UbiH/UbiF/VisC/COQ6 family ubiquinone biosynthesis hydroxylase n=1 Tax=Fretibacter rubidus TaxID=570162 RepID=UPI00352B3DA5
MKTQFDIIIVGAGHVGLIAALASAQAGFDVALIDRADIKAPREDSRASTLAASSVAMLKNLGLWDALSGAVQPVHDMMIGEGRVGDISPLSLHFNGQNRDTPMAHMVENEILRRACVDAVYSKSSITILTEASVTDFDNGADTATVTLDSGAVLRAPLIVAADGRNSAMRRFAAIPAPRRDYDQSAIVFNISHSVPHGGVAHQLFLTGGPFAILPMVNNTACIVWSDKTRAVDAALALPPPAFKAEVMRRMGDVLGEIEITTTPYSYPLTLQLAEQYTQGRLALIGDAAHVILPLAGQGLNMGLRDAAALIDVITTARGSGLDIGGAILAEYGQWRRFDNNSLATMTDALNLLFSNPVAPLRHLRRLGLAAVDSLPMVGAFFVSEAAGETGERASLMR